MKCFKVEIGKVYPSKNNGYFKVLSKLKNKNKKCGYYLVEFLDTGFIKELRTDSIKNGVAKDWLRPSRFGVGYIGVGTYAATFKGKGTKCAIIWKHMLERCYSPQFQKRSPTYVGCTVTPEWHNFQIFAKWFYENYPKDGKVYELDKDFKVKNNKVYAPNTCTFLSPYKNKQISHEKFHQFVNPEGVLVEITNLEQYCKYRNLTSRNMGKVHRGERPHHKGWTKYVE